VTGKIIRLQLTSKSLLEIEKEVPCIKLSVVMGKLGKSNNNQSETANVIRYIYII